MDFGTGAPILRPDGKHRRPYVFRVVLSFSRKAYSEVVYHQTTEDFLRCLENAFWYFGGVPQTIVIDNLKAAVTQADWYDPGCPSEDPVLLSALRDGDPADEAADASAQGQGRKGVSIRPRATP